MIQEEEEDDENMDKMWKSFFSDIMYILHHYTTNFCMLLIFHTFFTLISLKVKSTSNFK